MPKRTQKTDGMKTTALGRWWSVASREQKDRLCKMCETTPGYFYSLGLGHRKRLSLRRALQIARAILVINKEPGGENLPAVTIFDLDKIEKDTEILRQSREINRMLDGE